MTPALVIVLLHRAKHVEELAEVWDALGNEVVQSMRRAVWRLSLGATVVQVREGSPTAAKKKEPEVEGDIEVPSSPLRRRLGRQ